jgi:hypothetical protein
MTSDYDSLSLSTDIKDEIMFGWLIISIGKFLKCKTNLSDRDDVFFQFNNDLKDTEKIILASLMICEWLSPKLYSTENLHNFLTTKDWNNYSPANLLKEIRLTHDKAQKDADKLIMQYLHKQFDPKDLKKK